MWIYTRMHTFRFIQIPPRNPQISPSVFDSFFIIVGLKYLLTLDKTIELYFTDVILTFTDHLKYLKFLPSKLTYCLRFSSMTLWKIGRQWGSDCIQTLFVAKYQVSSDFSSLCICWRFTIYFKPALYWILVYMNYS